MSKYPSDHKINVNVEPMGGIHLSECDFTVHLYVNENKILSISKDKLKKIDDDNYIITFNSKDVGRGSVKLYLTIQIPDADYEKGYKQINTKSICTGVVDL